MQKKRVFPFVILVVLVVVMLASCGPAPAPATQNPSQPPAAATEPAAAPTQPAAAPAGGTLVIAMNLDDVVTLDPAYAG